MASSHLDEAVAGAADPDRRLVDGPGKAPRRHRCVVLSLERERAAREHAPQNLYRLNELLESRAQLLEPDAGGLVLGRVPTRAHAGDQPSVRQDVDRRQRLGQQGGRAQLRAEHQRAEPHARGRPRQRAERSQRVEGVVLAAAAVLLDPQEEMVGEPHGVEPQRLGPPGVRQHRLEPQRALARHGEVELRQSEPDVHRTSVSTCSSAS